jgi:DNA polymerase I-like protein with 3'-5' exonuclease and polymerase domains
MVKQIVYGLCYGMGSGRMAAALDVSELKARELSEDFKGCHPALTAWMQVCGVSASYNRGATGRGLWGGVGLVAWQQH